jgi:hypothetical protein
MRLALTYLSIKNIKERGRYMDTNLPGFGIRVGLRRKAWIVIPDKSRTSKIIGYYPEMSLQTARNIARGILTPKTRISMNSGWKEAAIAWSVCASIHREYAKGKDPLFKTRQADFTKYEENARSKLYKFESEI